MASSRVLAALRPGTGRQLAGRVGVARPFSTAEKVYDFVVVGAGASGAVLASRLSEDPAAKVLLIEAGQKPSATCDIPGFCAGLQNTAEDWQFLDSSKPGSATKGMRDQRMKLPRGKALGGSTSINYMAYVRGHPGDFDSWAANGASGWSYKDVLPYFKKSEDFSPGPDEHMKGDKEAHGFGGPCSVSYRDPVLPSVTAFVRAAEQCGFTAGDYNGAGRVTAPRGPVGAHQFTIRDGRRCSTHTAFLEPIMETRPNLTVLTGTEATRILVRDGKAVGVEHGSGHVAAAAKEVLLSCGAYMSPNLLLSSGIGPRGELEAQGVQCLVDSPHVGKHLKDHLSIHIQFPLPSSLPLGVLLAGLGATEDKSLFNEYLATGKGLAAASFYEASLFTSTGLCEASKHTHDAQISWCPTCADRNLYAKNQGFADYSPETFDFSMFDLELATGMLMPQLLQPQSEGEVLLSDARPGSRPIIKHNYLTDPIDVKVFTAICKEALAIKAHMPDAGDVYMPKKIVAKHGSDLDNDALWEDWLRNYANTVYHPVSTCGIGRVVDERCKVMGVSQLRVVDASIMPNIPAANTQAPSVMIGEKAAAMIAEDHGLSLKA